MGLLAIGGLVIGAYLLLQGRTSHGAILAPATVVPPARQAAIASTISQMQNQEAAHVAAVNEQSKVQTFAGDKANPIGYTGAAVSGASAGLGVITALPAIGVIGASTLGFGVAALAIYGILSAHHKAAVKNEAHLLNTSYPVFEGDFDRVVRAYKARAINAREAIALLNQARTTYYAQVSNKGAGSIEGKWPWSRGAGYPNNKPNSAFYWGKPNDFPHSKPSTCNGPCVVGHFWVEAPVEQATDAINGTADKNGNYAGHGVYSFAVGGAPPHAGYLGSPSISYTL